MSKLNKDSKGEWFVALQRLLPQHWISRLGGRLAESERPWLKNALIKKAIEFYDINMTEAEHSEAAAYRHFNDFFTRALKADARPIDSNKSSIVCPADGAVSQIGDIKVGDVFQAKGKSFSVEALLGAKDEDSKRFMNGHFTTIYLSPKDYHRVHMPLQGTLDYCRYIPGRLFSVNDVTTKYIDGLFAKNERLVCLFDTPAGRCAVILVGAMMVAGIESVWHGHYQPKGPMETFHASAENPVILEKGEEMGRFKFGSTVILLFEENAIEWHENYQSGKITRLGELLASQKEQP